MINSLYHHRDLADLTCQSKVQISKGADAPSHGLSIMELQAARLFCAVYTYSCIPAYLRPFKSLRQACSRLQISHLGHVSHIKAIEVAQCKGELPKLIAIIRATVVLRIIRIIFLPNPILVLVCVLSGVLNAHVAVIRTWTA